MKKILNYILLIFFCGLNCYSQVICDIHTDNGGSIETHPGSQVGIFGNLNNDGNFTQNGGGQVGFYNQNNEITISGNNAPEISELIIDVPNNLNLEINTIVNLGVTFTNGHVITPRENPDISLDLNQTDLYIFEADSRHVDGYTSYIGNNSYTYPVGDGIRLRELITEAGASVNTGKAAYFFENPDQPSTFSPFDRTETDNTIPSISAEEFWDLNGDTTTRVTLTWDILSNINSLIPNNDLNELRVVGWSISQERWIDLGNTSFTNNLQVGQITSEPFTPDDFEVITFGGPGNDSILPEGFRELEVFNAISANDDNENPYFRIKGINEFPNNNLKIFNRWGVIVFEVDGYRELELEDEIDPERVFVGKSNGRVTINKSENLPTATYFYILNYDANEFGNQKQAGFLYLQN